MKSSKTTLAMAVTTAIAAMAASSSAFAVSMSTDGLGQVALIPFYDVNNGMTTNISVVNTSKKYVVAFKIRFRDAYESQDVRDFNVYLSPNDIWSASVSKQGADLAIVKMTDNSCTVPDFSNKSNYYQSPYQIQFARKGLANTPTESQTGHIEIIEMGVADPTEPLNQVAKAAVHVNGVPKNCSFVENSYRSLTYMPGTYACSVDYPSLKAATNIPAAKVRSQEFCVPRNVLKVSANLVSTTGVAIDIPVDMMKNFVAPQLEAKSAKDKKAALAYDIMFEPSSVFPGLGDVIPQKAEIVDDTLGPIQVAFSAGTGSALPALDAVSSLFSALAIQNEYIRGVDASGVTSLTDWVITFPLKSYYAQGAGLVYKPATAYNVVYNYYDKNENNPPVPVDPIPPSPPDPKPVTQSSLKFETQVLQLGSSMILGSNAVDSGLYSYDINSQLDPTYVSGWMSVNFADPVSLKGAVVYDSIGAKAAQPVTIKGIPVQGFAVSESNSLSPSPITEPHAYQRYIGN